MTTSTRADSWDLTDYARVLRRRWPVVAVLTVLGLAVGVAVVALASKTYTATASVYVNALPNEARPTTAANVPVDMDTEAQLAKSHAVLQLARKRLAPASVSSSALSVTVPANTTVLDIACQASAAKRAANCANAFAAAYLAVRRGQAANAIRGQIVALHAKESSILPAVVHANLQARHISRASASTRITRQLQARAASAQLNALVSSSNLLTTELASLQAPNSTMAGHLVNAASAPGSPSSPRTLLVIPSALIVGLVLGLIVAFLLEFRDERVHEARELERTYGIPTLLDLREPDVRAAADLALTGAHPPPIFSQLAEYVANASSEGCLVVVVAGGSTADGRSLVAANLAAALSEARPDVFLVSADPSSTLVPQHSELDHVGLNELLTGQATIDQAATRPGTLSDLRVIAPGSERALHGLRSTYDARSRLMAALRSRARYVIVESSLDSPTPATSGLAEFGDTAVIVVETPRTTRREVESWLGHLERIRIPALGAVVLPRLEQAAAARLTPALIGRRRAATSEAASSIPIPARSAGMTEQQGSQ